MRDKLVLRFLGFLETMKYILEQSHGVPPVSVALDHTTVKEEGSCGYSSVKTVRSIASNDTPNSAAKFGDVLQRKPLAWYVCVFATIRDFMKCSCRQRGM